MEYNQSIKQIWSIANFNDYTIGVNLLELLYEVVLCIFIHESATKKIIGWFNSFNDAYLTILEGFMDRNTWKIGATPIIKVHLWLFKETFIFGPSLLIKNNHY